MHPACSCVTSRGVFTLLCMSNSNNLKALCIPHGEWRTIFLREKKIEKHPYKYNNNNNKKQQKQKTKNKKQKTKKTIQQIILRK